MYFWEPCVTTIQSISKSEDGPTSRRPVPVVPLAQWKVRWGFRCLLEKKNCILGNPVSLPFKA